MLTNWSISDNVEAKVTRNVGWRPKLVETTALEMDSIIYLLHCMCDTERRIAGYSVPCVKGTMKFKVEIINADCIN